MIADLEIQFHSSYRSLSLLLEAYILALLMYSSCCSCHCFNVKGTPMGLTLPGLFQRYDHYTDNLD